MIPIRDNNPTRGIPLITIFLIVLNIYVYYQQVTLPAFGNDLMTGTFGFVPYELTHNADLVGAVHIDRLGHVIFHPGERAVVAAATQHFLIPLGPAPHPHWITIFTAMFMHGSIAHIGGNMLFLWVFGKNVEDALGKGTFLFFYLFCGFVAALAQTASSPDSMIPNIGASGAIAGVMGAYFVLWPGSKVLTLLSLGFFWILREISAGWVLLFWIALQAAMAYFSMGGEATGGVAYFAHIGGFLAGILLVILLGGPSLGEKQRRAALKK